VAGKAQQVQTVAIAKTRPHAAGGAPISDRPQLILFFSSRSGRSRRVEAYLAAVLQQRRNHATFRLYRVAQEQRPDLLERFGIRALPTLLVASENVVRARLERPTGANEIRTFLNDWLR
jgi:thioredoxin-like negative regulator of GroEL